MNLQKYISFLLLCAFVCVVNAGVNFTDCGSTEGTIKEVVIEGCTTLPCHLKKGTTVKFTVDFISKEKATSATAVVHGIIGEIPIPFPLDNPDGCKNSGLTCPLKASTSYSYVQTIEVKKSYPVIKVPVKWELKDENKKDLFCMVVFTEIVN